MSHSSALFLKEVNLILRQQRSQTELRQKQWHRPQKQFKVTTLNLWTRPSWLWGAQCMWHLRLSALGLGYTGTPHTHLDTAEVSEQTRESIINRFAGSHSQNGHSGWNIYQCCFKGTFQITKAAAERLLSLCCTKKGLFHFSILRSYTTNTSSYSLQAAPPVRGWSVLDQEQVDSMSRTENMF